MITKGDVLAARERIRSQVHLTPLLDSTRLGAACGGVRLGFKCESFQKTGSFKARGALNAVLQLDADQRARGVVTVSAGNHAAALAWAASIVGTTCVTVMPEVAPRSKVEATRGYGGMVEQIGGERQRIFDRAQQIASEGRVMIHPFEDDAVAAGAGTVGLELLEQAPRASTLVVPIGGGGLIAGIAVAMKETRPDLRIVGVEPEGANAMRRSLDAGSPQRVEPRTVADGLAAPMAGAMTYETVRRYVDDVVIVSDDEIIAALRDIMLYAKLVAEPAAASGLAALATGRIGAEKGSQVVVVLSGGNVDLERLKGLL
jgi:threonine dehydratase